MSCSYFSQYKNTHKISRDDLLMLKTNVYLRVNPLKNNIRYIYNVPARRRIFMEPKESVFSFLAAQLSQRRVYGEKQVYANFVFALAVRRARFVVAKDYFYTASIRHSLHARLTS